jgi:hypothetical protein
VTPGRREISGAAAVLAALVLAAGCGGGGGGGTTPTTGTQTTGQKTATAKKSTALSAADARRCRSVPSAARTAIRRALKDPKAALTPAQAVRSTATFKRGLRHPYFVTAYVTNKKGKPGQATWATRNLRGSSLVVPVGALAHSVTSGKPGVVRRTQLSYGLTQKADGYRESRGCAQKVRKAQRKAKG